MPATNPLSALTLASSANLKGYWEFNNNSNDVQGTYNGTDTAMSYTLTGALFSRKCAIFAGTPSYVTATGLDTTTSAFSVGGWLKTSSTNNQMIINFGNNNAANSSFGIVMGNVTQGYLRCSDLNTGGGAVIGLQASNDGSWHHVVAQYAGGSGGATSLYIDSVSQGSSTWSGNVTNNNTVFGYNSVGSEQAYTGDLEDWFYFNRLLTQAEINYIYNGYQATSGHLLFF